MKISAICPTYGRHDRHETLYAAFAHQTHADRELLVLDDSRAASPFFVRCGDPRVRYWHLAGRATVGAKRNLLAERATGDVLAHFDDDDYYAPGYLAAMLALLGDGDLAKLSSWLAYRELDRSFWRWDARSVGVHYRVSGDDAGAPRHDFRQMHPAKAAAFIDDNVWGFGFSYVYRRDLWRARGFDDVSHGEDTAFARAAMARGAALVHAPDERGLTLHVLHATSSSLIYPQERVADDAARKLLGDAATPWTGG